MLWDKTHPTHPACSRHSLLKESAEHFCKNMAQPEVLNTLMDNWNYSEVVGCYCLNMARLYFFTYVDTYRDMDLEKEKYFT